MSGRFVNLDAYHLEHWRETQITLSGGASSAYQAWHIMEANGGLSRNWQVVFCNTGFERDETLDFVADFARNVGVPVVWLERQPAGKVARVTRETASRTGQPFHTIFSEPLRRRDGTMGVRPLASDGPRRLCSGLLKTQTAHKYLRSLGWGRYRSVIGFRADEKLRVERKRAADAKKAGVVEGGIGLFPMFDAGVTSADVIAFGEAAPAWWLKMPSWQSNCWPFCLMMSEWKLKERIAMDLPAARRFIEFEGVDRGHDARTGVVRNQFFRPGRKTVAQLIAEVERGDFSVDPKALKVRPECGTCGA